MAVPDTSVAGHSQSEIDWDDGKNRYSAPEVQWFDESSTGKFVITKESDVYGMAMIAYRVSSNRPVSSCPRVKSHVSLQGIDG